MKFDDYVNQISSQLIQTTQELVRIRSVEENPVEGGPFGQGVKDCLEKTLEICSSLGFYTKNVDGYAGYAEIGEGEDLIGILVHLDVVPEGDGWSYAPYSGKIVDGKLYGRGSTDNKGPAVSVIYALHLLKELNVDFKKRIRIIFGCNEESGWKGIKYYFEKEEKPCCGFTPDGLFPIINSEKGILQVQLTGDFNESALQYPLKLIRLKGGLRPNMVPDYCECELYVKPELHRNIEKIIRKYQNNKDLNIELKGDVCKIESRGIAVASSIPEKGKNAISEILKLLMELPFAESSQSKMVRFISENIGQEIDGKKIGLQMKDEISGPLTVNLGMADFNENRGAVTLDIRYPVKSKESEILQRLKQSVEKTGISVVKSEGKAPLYVPKDHFIIKKLSQIYEEVTGTEATLLSIGGGTYARAMDNIVAFGSLFPGRPILAHQKDEFLYIEDLIKMTKIYAPAIQALVEDDSHWS